MNDHKLWSVLLELKKLHFNENNLYYCFAEYKSLTALLVSYINRYSGIIDISSISIETDDQFKSKFFAAAIKCFELSDAKYGQILSSSTIVCDASFDIDNVPTSKMNVLIDNGIIRMSKGCLVSIRNKYKDVLYRYIRQNIGEYVDMMSADMFVFAELVELLSWDVEDDHKITLLGFTSEKISVIGKNYADRVLSAILKNHFVLEDLPYLLQEYDSYTEGIRTSIFDLSVKNYARVLECASNLTELFIKELLSCDRIDDNKKFELFIVLLQTISIDRTKDFAMILKRPDLVAALDPSKRPRISYNTLNKNILDQYKQRAWIYDYSANEDNTYYTVKKAKPVANRSVDEVLL